MDVKHFAVFFCILFLSTIAVAQNEKEDNKQPPSDTVYVDIAVQTSYYHLHKKCTLCLTPKPISLAQAKASGLTVCSSCKEGSPAEWKQKGKNVGSGDYGDVEIGMRRQQVDEFLGYGETQSRSTMGYNLYETVYYRRAEDYSYVIVITFIDKKVYSKQEIIH